MGMLIAYLLGILSAINPKDRSGTNKSRTTNEDSGLVRSNGPLEVTCVQRVLSEEEQTDTRKLKRRETISFWVGNISLGVLVVYAGFTILIWRANKQSADAATRTLHNVNRAFVVFTKTDLHRNILGPEMSIIWDVTPMVVNEGITPAFGAIQYAGGGLLTEEPTESQFVGNHYDFKAITIGPKDSQALGPVTVTDAGLFGRDAKASHEVDGISFPSQIGFYAWGWMAYRDIFESPHITEYCEKLTGITGLQHTDLRLTWRACGHHNCTDDYCEDRQDLTSKMPNRSNSLDH